MDKYTVLYDYLEERKHMPFEWGYNDCVTFAVGYLERIGVTGILDGIPKWYDEKEADKIIYAMCGNYSAVDLLIVAGERFIDAGMKEVEIPLMQRGDIVAVSTSRGTMLTICVGDKLAAPGKRGVVYMKKEGLIAWRAK